MTRRGLGLLVVVLSGAISGICAALMWELVDPDWWL